MNIKWIVAILMAFKVCISLADQGYYREVYYNIAGNDVINLTSAAKFPDSPDDEHIIDSIFETPTNIGDNYGQRLRAYITPLVTGNYTFYIASDNEGQLWLSTDDNPANMSKISWVDGWTGVRVWNEEAANQESAPIPLTAGTRYYVEVLQKEGGGGDNCAIGWTPPGESTISVVPAEVLTPYLLIPEIRTQPQPVVVYEQDVGIEVVSFTVEADRSAGIDYQWQADGADIPGAVESTYSLVADVANSNKLFRCVLTSSGGSVTSDAVGYSIIPDTVSPVLQRVGNFHDLTKLTLFFSEALAAMSAEDPANYTISGNAVTEARVIQEYNAVVLTLADALQPGVPISLSFSVNDLATPANNLSVSGYSYTPAAFAASPVELVRGMDEPAGPSSRRTQLAITEINHTPAVRVDGRDVRFIELYNSDPFYIDISGYQFSGAFGYVVPEGTVIPANGYLVVAPVPADITAVYGIANVIGGFDALGFDGTASIKLEDELGAWLSTVNYSDDPPWPAAPDGTGHTLVLKRPSRGEVNVEAWGSSAYPGGSPGVADPDITHGYEGVVFNEVLTHSGGSDGFVELYNFSGSAVDLAGCVLKEDDPASIGFILPAGSVVSAGGYLAFTESQCGFLINGRGDKLYLYAPAAAGSMVVDALEFDDQEAGVAYGRTPDGGPIWNRLQVPTAAGPNARRKPADVVLNEIMYHPLREKRDDEYIELHNTTTNDIPLSGWKLSGDISHHFVSEVLPAGGYLVVPRDRSAFIELYPAVSNVTQTGYSGSLPDGRGTVVLERPAFVMDTNEIGGPVLKEKCVAVEELRYRDGGNWHKNADGLGSSLERMDADADPMLAASWQASDETEKSDWVTLEFSGKIDLGFGGGVGTPDEIHIGLMDQGECLIDSVEVYEEGGANLVNNSSFESDTLDWNFTGTHDGSEIVEDADAPDGARVLHLKTTGHVHTGANCVRGTMSRAMATSGNGTIRVKARWLSGMPELLVRTKGNWIEASGSIITTFQLGTPGSVNSGAPLNAPPSITEVIHQPLLPRNGEAVTVYARVEDADGLMDAQLHYRVDGVEGEYSVAMRPCSAGLMKGVIPAGQPDNAIVAFYVEAVDASTSPLRFTYPSTAPVRECLVRYNEPLDTRNFGIYRFWLSGKNYDYWNTRQAGSNKPVDITFIYNNRPVYEAGAMFAGSPFHSSYPAPINSTKITDYKLEFLDDQVLDAGRMILASTGNLGNDDVGIKEQFNYELVRALKQAYPHRRFVHLYANGTEQNTRKIYEDSEKPNKAYIERWFSENPDGDFFKIDDWFEFDLEEDQRSNINATLQEFKTDAPDGDGEVLKLGRYRWNWQKRGEKNFRNNDYTNFFSLVEALNIVDETTYTARVRDLVRLKGFAGIIAMNHFIVNWDTYGYNRGKNMYLFDAESGWSLVAWDLDFNFGDNTITMDPYNGGFPVNDPTMRRFLQNPVVNRVYWRAVMDLLDASQDSSIRSSMRARYDALQADNTNLTGSYDNHFSLADQRYTIVSAELDSVNPDNFSVTAPAAAVSNSSDNVMSVSGIAPFEAVKVLVNGVDTPVTWTTPTAWSVDIVLNGGTNAFSFSALDRDGVVVAGGAVGRQVVYTGAPLDSMEDYLVISEIMTLPVTNDAEYVEIYNSSATTVMNLGGLYVEGSVEFTFPAGMYLYPGESCLLVEDPDVFAVVYPDVDPAAVCGKYSGRLYPAGGSVILKRPATGFELNDVVIDRVDYGSAFPWPAVTMPGVALQLNNPAIDSGRPANWSIFTNSTVAATNTVVDWSAAWNYSTAGYPGAGWYEDGFNDSAWPSGSGPLGWETGTALPVPIATSFALTGKITYYFRREFIFSGDPETARLLLTYMLDDAAIFYLNGSEIKRSSYMPLGEITDITPATEAMQPEGHVEGPFVISSSLLRTGVNTIAVGVHQITTSSSDLVFGMKLDVEPLNPEQSTPGTVNIVENPLSALSTVWLNEIQTRNITGPVDDDGEHEPWVELYNSGTDTVSLAGWKLVTAEGAPGWSFPAGSEIAAGDYLRIWLDGEVPAVQDPASLHTGIAFGFASGMLALVDGNEEVVDYLTIDALAEDTPYGCWPDGNFSNRRVLNPPTPGAANRVDKRSVCIVINELMADNGIYVNPLSGDADDWFELFNDGTDSVDLGGYLVSDTLSGTQPPVPDPLKSFIIPDGVVLSPGEALRIWTGADNAETLPFDPDNLQAPFGLSKNGDSVYLFNAATSLVDSVVYAEEKDDDDSLGRWVNGEKGEWVVFDEPTPGLPNRNPIFGDGYIVQPSPVVIPEGLQYSYTNMFVGSRPSGFEFRLFSAGGTALPEGVSLDQNTGVLNWTPSEAQGPGLYEFDLVGYIVDGVNVTACDHLLQTIAVEEMPSLPVITPLAPVNVSEGSLVTFNVDVTRPVEIPYYETFTTLRVEGGLPSNALFNAENGDFSWQTEEIDGPSVHHIKFVAEDSAMPELCCEMVVTVSVAEVNSSFTYASPMAFYLWNNEDFKVELKHNDPDLPPNDFSYLLISGPAGCTVDFDTGVLEWQPDPGYTGSQSVRFRAYDNEGAARSTTITLYVGSELFATGEISIQADGSYKLDWASKPDAFYIIEWSPSLVSPLWQSINSADPLPGTGGSLSYIVDPVLTGMPGQAFFRLRQIR